MAHFVVAHFEGMLPESTWVFHSRAAAESKMREIAKDVPEAHFEYKEAGYVKFGDTEVWVLESDNETEGGCQERWVR